MNDPFAHLFRKSRDAKRGGHEAWAVQSTGEKVAVALVLNRADWLAEIGYTLPEAIERSGGVGSGDSADCPPACRGGVKAMQRITLQRLYQVSGITAAIVLALPLVGTTTGRETLAWITSQPRKRLQMQHTFTVFPWTGSTRPARNACSSTQAQEAL